MSPISGQHYWYDYSADMSCNDFYPAFLLYNAGELNAFGWAFNIYHQSPRYEHPTPDVLHVSSIKLILLPEIPSVIETFWQSLSEIRSTNPVLAPILGVSHFQTWHRPRCEQRDQSANRVRE
jgi:hypothetical protein